QARIVTINQQQQQDAARRREEEAVARRRQLDEEAAARAREEEAATRRRQLDEEAAARRRKLDEQAAPRRREREQRAERSRCGWYAISFCSKSRADAENWSRSRDGFVIDTDSPDYPNFRAGWYCVVKGPMSRTEALSEAERFRRFVPTAYAK